MIPIESIEKLIPILQTAVSPMILISGLGLLLLTMTNRLGRIIDRSRSLSSALVSLGDKEKDVVRLEIDILWRRAKAIRIAILLVACSCLSASLLIIFLFLSTLTGLNIPEVLSLLFITSMACLISSLLFFLFDINSSLSALQIELMQNKR